MFWDFSISKLETLSLIGNHSLIVIIDAGESPTLAGSKTTSILIEEIRLPKQLIHTNFQLTSLS